MSKVDLQASWVVEASGAELVGPADEVLFTSVEIDSRQVDEGSLFVALSGDRTDGHLFVEDVFAKGVKGALVSRFWFDRNGDIAEKWAGKVSFFVVGEPLTALQRMGKAYRDRFEDIVVIGITGSNGKTTTKEVLASVLKSCGNVVYNEGNLNSEIGLPLQLFRIRPEHRFAVFEMGMNRVGEMDLLAGMASPDVAVITNVGTAHIGMLGSREAIAEEKKKIFSCFTGKEIAVLPADDPWSEYLSEGIQGSVHYYGIEMTSGVESVEDRGLGGSLIRFKGKSIRFPLPGRFNLQNALAAVTTALLLDVPEGCIVQGLEDVEPEFGRGEVFQGRVTLIRDCYNANPDSTAQAVKMAGSVEFSGRRVAVLGDMLELGGESSVSHREIGRLAAGFPFDGLFLVGPLMENALEAIRETEFTGTVYWSGDYASVKDAVLDFVREGDLVLLKGSRGMALERLTDPLLEV